MKRKSKLGKCTNYDMEKHENSSCICPPKKKLAKEHEEIIGNTLES